MVAPGYRGRGASRSLPPGPGPPAAAPYKRWRRPMEEIRHWDRYDRDQFISDAELEDWIKTRRHRVMYKDASKID